jgi:hypothetical protein
VEVFSGKMKGSSMDWLHLMFCCAIDNDSRDRPLCLILCEVTKSLKMEISLSLGKLTERNFLGSEVRLLLRDWDDAET